MNYVLAKTVSGKTYYARIESSNAVTKTEDIHQAKIFDSEASAKKLREHATKKVNSPTAYANA